MASTPAVSTQKIYLKSMRDYLTELKRLGELIEVDREVNWNLEVGATIRRVYETQSPAALFNRIKGIERGFRIFGAPVRTSFNRNYPEDVKRKVLDSWAAYGFDAKS